MKVIGKVESLWRYPVKSMRGEELKQAFIGFAGVYGDRFYAFTSSGAQKGFPFLTGREKHEMLLYKPVYRYGDDMLEPPNLAEAASAGATPLYPDPDRLAVDVHTPSGKVLSIDDPALLELLVDRLFERHQLKLIRSNRSITDCRPVSLFSLGTLSQLVRENEIDLDKRRFRANIYADFMSGVGFEENALVGRQLRIGSKAVIAVMDRDSRCKMITLDPDTGKATPQIMKRLASAHDGQAGVYCAVLVEGVVVPGDKIALFN